MGKEPFRPRPGAIGHKSVRSQKKRGESSEDRRVSWSAESFVLSGDSLHPGDATGLIPIGDIDIGIFVNKTSVRRAEGRSRDLSGFYVVFSPLGFLRIVSKKSDGNIVSIEDRSASLQFRNYSIVAIKADLAWPAEMLGDCAHEFSVEVELA